MSKTTPVRWWRDDATRYQSRPLIGVCRTTPETTLQWAFELIGNPVNPELQRCFDRYAELTNPGIAAFMAIPAELLKPREQFGPGLLPALLPDVARGAPVDPWGDQAMRDGRSIADPIADIKAALADQDREIGRRDSR